MLLRIYEDTVASSPASTLAEVLPEDLYLVEVALVEVNDNRIYS